MEEISGGKKQTAKIDLRYDTKKSVSKNQDQVWKSNKATDVADEYFSYFIYNDKVDGFASLVSDISVYKIR